MSLNCLLDPLGLQTDITLRDRRTAVLQKPLHERDVVSVVLVNFCRVPLSEAVSADPVITQISANKLYLLLDSSFRDRKYQIGGLDAISQAVVFYVLLNDEGNGKDPVFSCLLLHDVQAITISVPNNIARRRRRISLIRSPRFASSTSAVAIRSFGRQPQKPSFIVVIISMYCSVVRAVVFLFIASPTEKVRIFWPKSSFIFDPSRQTA